MLPVTPNYPAWKFYMDLFHLIGLIGIGFYTWWTNREKVTSRRFAKLEEEVVKRATTAVTEALTLRTSTIEAHLKNVPACCTGHELMTTRLDGHNKRLGQHKELIDRLAGDVRHLPKVDDLAQVHKRVDEVFGLAQSMAGELKGISRNLDLVLDHHLKER